MHKIILVILVMIIIVAVAGIFTAEYYTATSTFCGTRCHIMKKPYNSWMVSKHKDVACVDCHYAPGEKNALKSKLKGLAQLFSYLAEGETEVRKAARVLDESCTTSQCHPSEKFETKKIVFKGEDTTKEVPFIHKTHLDKTIDGQKLHCNTCHQHVRTGKHFQVPKLACHLCHFKNAGFNDGRSKCSLCHIIPDKPLQKQEEVFDPDRKIVTHKSLEKSKVSCHNCHYQIIQGKGNVKKEDCFHCHEYSADILTKADDKKMMHKEHIADQNANCFDCHMPIEHRETDFIELARSNCSACHPDHHIHQKLLLSGTGGRGIEKSFPIRHFEVKLNCYGCHTEKGADIKGVEVLKGSAKNCIRCHTEDEGNLAKKWKSDTLEMLKEARAKEKEAISAIEASKGRVPAKSLKKAEAMLKDGQYNLRIVDAGGGVHNKKYAVLLIDTAVSSFEDIVGELKKQTKQ